MGRKPKLPKPEEELAELRVRAKELFFSNVHGNEIARQLDLNNQIIARWRKEDGWDLEREQIERGIIEDAFSARRLTLSRITHLTSDQLERALKHLADRPEPPTLNEAEKLATILSALDKVLRLDAGKATENVSVQQHVQHTVESVRSLLAADPVLGSAIAAAKMQALPAPTVTEAEFSNA